MDYKRYLASNVKRRVAIIALRCKGWTWQRIAKQYGITRQRAQQIGKQ